MHLHVRVRGYSLWASPSLHIIPLTSLPCPVAQNHQDNLPKLSEKRPSFKRNLWEGLDPAFSPAAWEPLADLLQVTCPLGTSPLLKPPSPPLPTQGSTLKHKIVIPLTTGSLPWSHFRPLLVVQIQSVWSQCQRGF